MTRPKVVTALTVVFFTWFLQPAFLSAQPGPTEDVEGQMSKWIDVMKGIDPSKLSQEEQEQKADELTHAWVALMKGGPQAAEVIRKELAATPDDGYFQLSASMVLLALEEEAAGPAIGEALGRADPGVNFRQYVHLSFSLARSQEPYALSGIEKLLANEKGTFYVEAHAMTLGPEEILRFVAGVYGPGCVERVAAHLEDQNAVARAHACFLLGWFGEQKQASKLLELLEKDPSDKVRAAAARALGEMYYPAAVGRLVARFEADPSAEVRAPCLWALAELLAPEAVKPSIAGLGDPAANVRLEAADALGYLGPLEGARAVARRLGQEKDEAVQAALIQALAELGYTKTLGALEAFSPGQGSELEAMKGWAVDAIGEQALVEDRGLRDYLEGAGEPLPGAEFRQLLKDLMEKGGRVSSEQAKALMASARVEHIPALEGVRSRALRRLSDECLSDVERVTLAIRAARVRAYRASAARK